MEWIAETQAVDFPKNVSARELLERMRTYTTKVVHSHTGSLLTVSSRQEFCYHFILSPEQPVYP